jgi:hypothetical protein
MRELALTVNLKLALYTYKITVNGRLISPVTVQSVLQDNTKVFVLVGLTQKKRQAKLFASGKRIMYVNRNDYWRSTHAGYATRVYPIPSENCR